MRRTTLVALVILSLVHLAGCGSTRRTGRIVGGAFVGIGAASLVTGLTADTSGTTFDEAFGKGLRADLDVIGGVTLASIGAAVLLINEWSAGRAEPTEPAPPPVARVVRVIPGAAAIPDPPTDDGRLHQLTLQASLAARAGQCSAVRVIADRVADLDATFRGGGFLVDASIAACL